MSWSVLANATPTDTIELRLGPTDGTDVGLRSIGGRRVKVIIWNLQSRHPVRVPIHIPAGKEVVVRGSRYRRRR